MEPRAEPEEKDPDLPEEDEDRLLEAEPERAPDEAAEPVDRADGPAEALVAEGAFLPERKGPLCSVSPVRPLFRLGALFVRRRRNLAARRSVCCRRARFISRASW